MNKVGRFNDIAIRLCLPARLAFVFLVAVAAVGGGLLTAKVATTEVSTPEWLLPGTELVARDAPVLVSEPVPNTNTLVPRRPSSLASGFRWLGKKLHAGAGAGSQALVETLSFPGPHPDFEKGGDMVIVRVIIQVYRC